jgi:hypothetical protein
VTRCFFVIGDIEKPFFDTHSAILPLIIRTFLRRCLHESGWV